MSQGERTKEENEAIARIATAITKMLMKDGRLIELGFRLYLVHSFTHPGATPSAGIPGGMSEQQYDQLRTAFFSGAQHLFGSILTGLDEDREPTDEDMRKMTLIDNELRQFVGDFKKKHGLDQDPPETRQ